MTQTPRCTPGASVRISTKPETSSRAVHPVASFRLLAILAVGLLVVACADNSSHEAKPPNVILIMIDTLRADHLGSYGYSRATSPHMDAFASENLRFENVRSQAACTSPSVSSLLTSKSPITLLEQPTGHIGVPSDVPSLAQLLKMANYWTLAVTASPIVRKTPSEANRFGEFGAGFDVFHEECLMSDARCVNEAAFEALQVLTEPFFLYLHYMDVHAPYGPPSDFERRFSKNESLPPLVRMGRSEQFQLETLERGEKVRPTEVEHFRDLYDDEIAFLDEELGNLFSELKDRELLDRSILVIASDHGEAFQERDYLGHCRIPLFEAMTSTPLIMSIPGVDRTEPVRAHVQNLDITPTILDYLGFELSDLALDGVSLRPAIETNQNVNPFTYAIQGVEVTASDERHTLTYNLESGQQTLFDRISDPDHQHPLEDTAGSKSPELERQLHAWLATRARDENTNVARDARRLEDELRALGYIQSVEAPSGPR